MLGVLRAISEGENRFSDRPEEPYVLVTSISARRFGEFEDVGEIGGCGLAFERFLSEPFRSEHEKAKLMGENQVLGRFPRPGNTMRSYAGVRVSVSGRSHEEAKERALDVLDLLRGIWNLGINRYIGDRTSAGIRTSNNKFSLGPVHSLHHPDGRLADGPWVEADFVRPIISYRMDRDSEYVKEFEEWVREELGRIPYRRDLEAALRRYARALDRRDWDTSFVRLWGLLETLTGRLGYEKLEKRALLMMPERDVPYHRQILRHLSRYRNRNVHAGHETAAVLTLLYQLKFYVERLLEFHLSADPSFGSVGEAARFLDPPRNRDALRERTRPTKRRQGSGRRTACEEARGGRRDRWGRGPLVRIEPEEGLCREARPRLVGSHSRGYGLPAIALVWNGEEHAIEEAPLSALTSPGSTTPRRGRDASSRW